MKPHLKDELHAIYSFIDSATEGLILFDSKLNILKANSAALKLCNQENNDAKGLSVVDLFPELEGLGLSGRFMDVINTGKPYSSDYLLSDSQPKERHLHVKAFKVDDGLGVILEDVTERKRIENLIIRAKKEWERTFDTMLDPVVILDDGYRITRLNKAMASHLGLTPPQAIGLTCYKYICGEEEPPPNCLRSQMPKDKRPCVKDIYSKKLGGHFTVSMSPVLDGEERFIGSVHVFRDITERKRMEEELRKNEAILRKAQQQAKIGGWEWDIANNIFHSSEEMRHIYGIPDKEEFIELQSAINKYIHPEDRERLENATLSLTVKDSENEREFRIIRPDGEIRWGLMSKPEIIRFSQDGKPELIAGIFQDITEQVERQEERRRLESQLMQSEKMASIGQLAAGVAHEINNPIAFVNSNLTAMTDYLNDIMSLMEKFRKLNEDLEKIDAGTGLPDSLKEHLDHIEEFEKKVGIDFVTGDVKALIEESKEGIERIKKIVIDLKSFAHPGDEELKTVDINKGIESTLNVVWNELKYKAKVTKDYGDIPLVAGYPQKLNQVFMNLLVNAGQAIENTGEIRISTRAINGHVEVIISDTGVGIPEKNISKIFDPFFTTKEVGAGTGLGLNMAYNIIKKHNGTIGVESTVGKGTTFTVRIPVN